MRPSLLALTVLLAASASAQGAPGQTADRPHLGERAVLAVGALAGGVGAAAGTYGLLGMDYDSPVGVTLIVLAYPAGMTLGTVLMAGALGLDAPVRRTAEDALLGSVAGVLAGVVVGAAAGGVTFVVTQDDWGLISALVGLGVGGAVAAVTSSGVTVRRVRAAPAVLAAPTGERSLGLSLRLGL